MAAIKSGYPLDVLKFIIDRVEFPMTSNNSVLTVNSSSRFQESVTRKVVELVSQSLLQGDTQTALVDRELTTGVDFINEAWIGANFTAKDERTVQQHAALVFSDELVAEVFAADSIVIGAPMYNFSIPALLKAWFDQIARANLTFEYTQSGPQGLVTGKKAYVVIASGGVTVGSDYDFSSKYIQQVLGFIGITEVVIVDANQFDLAASDAEIQAQLSISMTDSLAA